MVVQHNLTAMNSDRMFGITTKRQTKATERLSSGYKINHAADDASGLSISEKMRKQIRGLTQASSNAQDGISAVQTAEGALSEVHDMLQRMNELAVKAANGTNSKTDRDYIQSEINQLVTEIDRVSNTTKFNETYLLRGVSADGHVGELTFNTAEEKLMETGIRSGDITADGKIGLYKDLGVDGNYDGILEAPDGGTPGSYATFSVEISEGNEYTLYAWITDVTPARDASGEVYGSPLEDAKKSIEDEFNSYNDPSDPLHYSAKVYSSEAEYKDAVEQALMSNILHEGGSEIKLSTLTEDSWFHSTGRYSAGYMVDGYVAQLYADVNAPLKLDLHVGADSSEDNKITLNLKMMSARALGINGLLVDGETADNATAAIDTITAAIQMVSSQRSTLGAVQNRLEHTVNNLDNIVENTTAAESQIRDTDMADEMVKFSNNNILSQAGQAMLAQANQSNQGVLSLLG